jgi:hypothetical protein
MANLVETPNAGSVVTLRLRCPGVVGDKLRQRRAL